MVFNLIKAGSTAYRLFVIRTASKEDFDMDHVMLLDVLGVIVLCAIEHYISRHQIFFVHDNR